MTQDGTAFTVYPQCRFKKMKIYQANEKPLKMQLNIGPDLISRQEIPMVFIKYFIESSSHSQFDPDHLKVDILTCRLCPQVKMQFMSHFTSPFIEPLCPPRYTTVQLWASIPAFHFHQAVEEGGGGKKDEVWGVHTPC